MAAVSASRLDIEWERGGDWERMVGRRTRADVLLPMSAGALEVRPIDASSRTPALVTCVGAVTAEGRVRLRATREQGDELPEDTYEYRVVVTDAASAMRLLLLRGYLRLVDTVGEG